MDGNDLCFLGGTPHGLMDGSACGAPSWTHCMIRMNAGVEKGKTYETEISATRKTNRAETLLAYQNDFYAGYPALTKMWLGEGEAYYVRADFEQRHFTMTSAGNWQKKKKGLERAAAEILEGLDVANK